jgi:hypothetical protein
MLHLTIENEIITGIHCTDNVKQLQALHPKAKIVEVDESFSGKQGESTKLFNTVWTRKLIKEE